MAEGRAGRHSDLDLAVVPASPAARGRRLDLVAALIAAGLDAVDLAILDGVDMVLRFEAVRPPAQCVGRPVSQGQACGMAAAGTDTCGGVAVCVRRVR